MDNTFSYVREAFRAVLEDDLHIFVLLIGLVIFAQVCGYEELVKTGFGSCVGALLYKAKSGGK